MEQLTSWGILGVVLLLFFVPIGVFLLTEKIAPKPIYGPINVIHLSDNTTIDKHVIEYTQQDWIAIRESQEQSFYDSLRNEYLELKEARQRYCIRMTATIVSACLCFISYFWLTSQDYYDILFWVKYDLF